MKTLILLLICFVLASCSSKKLKETTEAPMTDKYIKELINNWPEASQIAAKEMIEKYKLPQEATASKLTWYQTGSFKRSIVHKDEINHQFPSKHSDVLEQVIDYRVPFNRVDDLWNFNGSIVLAKTAGELSVWSESEEMNTLLFNLAVEIATDKKSSNEARKELSKIVADSQKGSRSSLMEEIKFSPAEKSADPDLIMIKEEVPRNAMNE